ncbi:MAG: hypothetical protein ACKPKO_30360, partial [Candidatus Fonsibacter sp.]
MCLGISHEAATPVKFQLQSKLELATISGSQYVKCQLKALVASDLDNNTPIMQHYDVLTRDS